MIGVDTLKAIHFLNQNLPVALPTETVYGLAANALNEEAITAIYKAKNRPFFDPLIIHVANIEDAKKYVLNLKGNALKLAQAFWPGPLTLLLPKKDIIPYLVTSGSQYVAVRVPNQATTLSILQQINYPLAAPSANPFGYISPTTAKHVEEQLGNKIPYILDGGECTIGIESTIIDCNDEIPKILRLGGLSITTIENVLDIKPILALNNNSNPNAPGQLDKHYSPRKPMIIVDDITTYLAENKNKNIAILSFGNNNLTTEYPQFNLSISGNLDEAAKNLFNYLHLLDITESELIITQLLPNKELGLAINDRLKRAAAK